MRPLLVQFFQFLAVFPNRNDQNDRLAPHLWSWRTRLGNPNQVAGAGEVTVMDLKIFSFSQFVLLDLL